MHTLIVYISIGHSIYANVFTVCYSLYILKNSLFISLIMILCIGKLVNKGGWLLCHIKLLMHV